MAGNPHNEYLAEGTATPEALNIARLEAELNDTEHAFGEIRFDVKQALLAYRDASEAQERLLKHLERVVKFATGQVPNV